jgi:RNA-directed DNA polymerase
MKLDKLHISKIKTSFNNIENYEDLLNLLNEVNKIIYGSSYKPYKLKDLTKYSFSKSTINQYTQFKINKKSGSTRIINAPVNKLKSIQRTLNIILQSVFIPHKSSFGFLKDRSIVDNAKIHLGMRYVYNVDLKDFFSSIDQARVWKTLQLQPFNLNNNFLSTIDKNENFIFKDGRITLKNKNRGRLDLANLIASLCCTELEVERKNINGDWVKIKLNVLPQGAPTSPLLSNVVCQKLDFLLTGVAKRFGLKYSRYADDITFSSMHNVYQPESEFLKELNRIIAEQNFHIKESKTRLQKNGNRKEVTGLLVNDKVNVQKRYIKQLRMWLYYWERYGYGRASSLFAEKYLVDKGHVKRGEPEIANVISGKLDYLKMVKGEHNELYLKLKKRFDLLIGLEAHVEYKNPTLLYNALLAFNLNPILRTTCHPISIENIDVIINKSKSEEYDFKKHLELIKLNFKKLAKKERFTTKMYSLINNYLNGEDTWSSQKINDSWSNKYLEEWANKHPNFVPNPEDSLIETSGNVGYPLENPFISKLTNQPIENFNDLVLYFKSHWHIKFDNQLQKILEKRNADFKYDVWANIQFINFSQTLNLYTDIDKLIQAYSKIIELIKENSNQNRQEIVISFYEQDSMKILSIHQLNTFWKKSISDTIEKPFGNSMLPLIKKQINGLSDLHIRAKFEGNKYYKVNLWDGNERKAKPISNFDGVEYLLVLKK